MELVVEARNLAKISFSTSAFGRPYFAEDNCFRADAKPGFGAGAGAGADASI